MSSPEKAERDDLDATVNELAKPFNLSTDGVPFDMDAILDAIPQNRRGIKYTDGWDPARLDEVNIEACQLIMELLLSFYLTSCFVGAETASFLYERNAGGR